MEDCIFCKIVKGDIPSKTIYEDDIVKVFMDINPNADGHLLIVPKKHIKDFMEMDNDTFAHINEIVKMLNNKVSGILNPDGIKLINNFGIFQEVKHYHLHFIPGYENKTELSDIEEIFNKLK